MALNSWQLIKRVEPGTPFGNGQDGDYSSATIPTLIKLSCSGTAASTALTASSTTIADNDLVMVHQTRGTGVGQWEINRVASGGGTVNLVMKEALHYTYTDSGSSQAQVIKIFQYADVTVQSGTWTVPAWAGNVGGVFPMAVSGTLTPTGTISGNSAGFRGGSGATSVSDNISAYLGEGIDGASYNTFSQPSGPNSSGGGAAARKGGSAAPWGGAGGGNGEAGVSGQYGGDAVGGLVSGATALTKMDLGGGAGGGFCKNSGTPGKGGDGSGIIVIFAKTFLTPTNIISNGATGTTSTSSSDKIGGSGGGAGGSILIVGETVDIGANKLSTIAGSYGSISTSGEQINGGGGGKGRVAIYYSKSLTGSVSSTYYGTFNSELDQRLFYPIRRSMLI